MRKISANRILPVSSPPLINGIITLDDSGRILELTDTGGNLREEPGLEFYNGIIVPGFILPWMRLEDAAVPLTRPGHPDRSPLQSAKLANTAYQPSHPDHSRQQSANQPGSRDPQDELANAMNALERELVLYGIKGVGLVLKESMVSDGGLERMSGSSLFYHPVIELCPGPQEDGFEAFHRGIELVSHAWNRFNLYCSLATCREALDNRDLARYLHEYKASHRNISGPADPGHPSQTFPSASLDILKTMSASEPDKPFAELLPRYTLEAASAIFEKDELGSIERGKQPGLNLVSVLPSTGMAQSWAAMKGYDPETFRINDQTSLKVLV